MQELFILQCLASGDEHHQFVMRHVIIVVYASGYFRIRDQKQKLWKGLNGDTLQRW